MTRDQAQAAVKVDPRAVASAWQAPLRIVDGPAGKVGMLPDGRITVQRRQG